MNAKRWYNVKKLTNQIRYIPGQNVYEIQAVKNGKIVTTKVDGAEFHATWQGKLGAQMEAASMNPNQWVEIPG